MTQSHQDSIPITALTGFLGSGKTTLLNHLLQHSGGRKIAVIINDYGDINIDANLIAGQTDTTLELTNGCVCCSLDRLELDDAIGQFAYAGSPIDHIVIEASGLAEPLDLARSLAQVQGDFCHFDAVVGLVDAANLPEPTSPEHRLAIDTIKAADLLITTKTDIATKIQIERLQQLVDISAPMVRRLDAVRGRVESELLLGSLSRSVDKAVHAHTHKHEEHLHHSYSSFHFTAPKPLEPAAFQNFVNTQLPASVYRAKGWVHLGHKGLDRKYIFQLVGKRASIHWEEWGAQDPVTDLVFIGIKIDESLLRKQLNACIDQAPSASADVAIVAPPAAR